MVYSQANANPRPSWFSVMVVGDPKRGLVGIGHGKNESIQLAHQRAFNQAVLNMDAVPRFENRTLYGQGADLRTKWRATTVIMRARPPGFGLQVPHVLHRIFSACGIRDASAQILGSTNKTQVVKAALQIIHGGVSFLLAVVKRRADGRRCHLVRVPARAGRVGRTRAPACARFVSWSACAAATVST